MIIRIKPFDTLFFRDGKPFSMGNEVWASGLFPPPPSVIYGALRTAYFANNPAEVVKANGKDDPTAMLDIRRLAVAIGDSVYYPAGQDLLVKMDTNQREQYLSFPTPTTLISASPFHSQKLSKRYILSTGNTAFLQTTERGSLFSGDELKKYLSPARQKGRDLFDLKRTTEYLSTDPKTGIGRSRHTGVVKEGLLYRVEMVRLATRSQTDISLVVEFEGLSIPSKGMLKLGGEGKAAAYEIVDTDTLDMGVPEVSLKLPFFKLYLTTPAIFSQGWIPQGLSPETLKGKINGIPIRLIGASVDKPIYSGGFDIKSRRFKPMKRAVSAGTVYFCELLENSTPDQVINALHGQSISDEKRTEGYGIAFLGNLPTP